MFVLYTNKSKYIALIIIHVYRVYHKLLILSWLQILWRFWNKFLYKKKALHYADVIIKLFSIKDSKKILWIEFQDVQKQKLSFKLYILTYYFY